MAIICLRLEAEGKLASHVPGSSIGSPHLSASPLENLPYHISAEEAHRMGDYRDILSLTRVLVHGPESKADVDTVIERYGISSYEWKVVSPRFYLAYLLKKKKKMLPHFTEQLPSCRFRGKIHSYTFGHNLLACCVVYLSMLSVSCVHKS